MPAAQADCAVEDALANFSNKDSPDDRANIAEASGMSQNHKDRSAKLLAKAVFETLENRQLMSAVTLADGVLSVEATDSSPLKVWVTKEANADQVWVYASGQKKQAFAVSEFSKLRIVGGAANDSIYIEPTITAPAEISTGGGDDKITSGGGDDAIDAGAGNDVVRGGNGADAINGGDGDDKILGGQGADVIHGGAGKDRIEGGSGRNSIYGEAGDDDLVGGPQADLIDGGDGSDRLMGGGGNDDLRGGDGDDMVRGESGDDVMDGGAGTNDMNGGAGKNVDNSRPDYRPPAPGGGTSGGTTDGTGGATDEDTGGSGSGGSQDNGGGTDAGGTDSGVGDTAAPQPIMEFISQNGMAGHTVHVNGLSSKLATNDPIGAKYEWDFGDVGSRYNKLTGWIGAHTYDQPGTYTVALTVTDGEGRRAKTTATVTIAPDTRKAIYVDPAGSDANAGRSPQQAVRTLRRASELVGDDSKLLIKNGYEYQVGEPLFFQSKNLTIGTYGDGAKARLVKVEARATTMLYILAGSKDVTIEGIEFDSKWGLDSSYGGDSVPARAMTIFGENVTVRNCRFRNLTDAVNTLGKPTGVLVQDNDFTNEMRGYGIWGEGTDHVYLGNTMRDSRRQHLIRTSDSGVKRLLIADNDLSRPSNAKGSIELRVAQWFYVTGNRIEGGTLRAGLQEDKNVHPNDWASEFTGNGVIENNHTKRIFLNIRPGLQHVAYRDNVVELDSSPAIIMQATMPGYDHSRKIDDIRFENNTVVNNGATGQFLQINGHTTNISVENNLYYAPNLVATGGGGSAAIAVADPTGAGLACFKNVSYNVWPSVSLNGRQGGLNYVWSTWGDTRGYQSPSTWENYAQVTDDMYRDVTLSGSYRVAVGSIMAGSSMKLAA